MKKILIVLLALALLPAGALAELIAGEGWWEDDYSGDWQYVSAEGLRVKLPDDWGEAPLIDEDLNAAVYMRDDYGIVMWVNLYRQPLQDVMSRIQQAGSSWNGERYVETGNLILKDDRDWYIIANSYSMCAFTDGENGGTVEFGFKYEEEESYRKIVRRVISSVESY